MSETFFWHSSGWQHSHACTDRAVQFGDGLFETMRCAADGSVPLADYHRNRLVAGLKKLGFSVNARAVVEEAFESACHSSHFGVIKLIVSRGETERGYYAPADLTPTFRLQHFPASDFSDKPLSVCLSDVRLSQQPALAGLKHLNRLEQVLARNALPDGVDEALMLDTQGNIIEGIMSNVLISIDGEWHTPRLELSGVNGVTLAWLKERTTIHESVITCADLKRACALVFCNTLTGFRSASSCGDMVYSEHAEVSLWQKQFRSLYL